MSICEYCCAPSLVFMSLRVRDNSMTVLRFVQIAGVPHMTN